MTFIDNQLRQHRTVNKATKLEALLVDGSFATLTQPQLALVKAFEDAPTLDQASVIIFTLFRENVIQGARNIRRVGFF